MERLKIILILFRWDIKELKVENGKLKAGLYFQLGFPFLRISNVCLLQLSYFVQELGNGYVC
jgi:hypothetical protein